MWHSDRAPDSLSYPGCGGPYPSPPLTPRYGHTWPLPGERFTTAVEWTGQRVIGRLLPERHHAEATGLMRAALYRGTRVECPCCGGRWRGFLPYWNRPNCLCPRCWSHERHRALWLYLRERTNLFTDELSVLHVAPEHLFQKRLRPLPNLRYLSADIEAPEAMMHFDIQEIPFDDASFDVIICAHVLTEVPDDVRAMREMHRVLRPDGWTIVMTAVDQTRAETREGPELNADRRRESFLEPTNIRIYGRDFADRLRGAGWDVRVESYVRELDERTIARYGLLHDDDIYLLRRAG